MEWELVADTWEETLSVARPAPAPLVIRPRSVMIFVAR